jgi:hypothetical protein
VTCKKTTGTRAQRCPRLESTIRDGGFSRASPAH